MTDSSRDTWRTPSPGTWLVGSAPYLVFVLLVARTAGRDRWSTLLVALVALLVVARCVREWRYGRRNHLVVSAEHLTVVTEGKARVVPIASVTHLDWPPGPRWFQPPAGNRRVITIRATEGGPLEVEPRYAWRRAERRDRKRLLAALPALRRT